MEIEQIKEYQVFKDFGKAVYNKNKITNAPEGHQKIRVHFVFDVKHCGKFKARLVADGHLTKEPMETVYSGVVSIRDLRLAMFLAQLNDLELWGADVGNDTIYIKTQVFRLLRYHSPAPRNIARSDWATQNITHNMTSPIT